MVTVTDTTRERRKIETRPEWQAVSYCMNSEREREKMKRWRRRVSLECVMTSPKLKLLSGSLKSSAALLFSHHSTLSMVDRRREKVEVKIVSWIGFCAARSREAFDVFNLPHTSSSLGEETTSTVVLCSRHFNIIFEWACYWWLNRRRWRRTSFEQKRAAWCVEN